MIASIPDGDEGEAEEETEGASHLSKALKNDISSARATRKADKEDGYDDHDQDNHDHDHDDHDHNDHDHDDHDHDDDDQHLCDEGGQGVDELLLLNESVIGGRSQLEQEVLALSRQE